MASNPPVGTVASKMQVFQDAQVLRGPERAGQPTTLKQETEVDVRSGRVARANTAAASSTSLASEDGYGDTQYNGRRKGDTAGRQLSIGDTGDMKSLTRSPSARALTSFGPRSLYMPLKLSSIPKQSRNECYAQRRESALDTQSTIEQRLSDARARLKPASKGIGEERDCIRTSTVVPSCRRRTDIHQLHDLIDSAIDEQVKPDMRTSAKQSPQREPVVTQVEMSMTGQTEKQTAEMKSSGSPMRRGGNSRHTSSPHLSAPARTQSGRQHAHRSSFLLAKQPSPTEKRRLSTESILPRSSIDSDPPAASAYPSVCSSPDTKPRQANFVTQPLPPDCRTPSPVKDRRAAFEKMTQLDKQSTNQQLYKHTRNFHVKQHRWPKSPVLNRAQDIEGQAKQESIAQMASASHTTQVNSPTGACATRPTAKPGPIPLALPYLVSSRDRDVSASSQVEGSFQTAPQSEAALSRLSSRVYPPRPVTQAIVAHGTGNKMKSPTLKPTHSMLDMAPPTKNAAPASRRDSNVGADVRHSVLEQARGILSPQSQLQSEGLFEAAHQDARSSRENDQSLISCEELEREVKQGPPNCSSLQGRDQVQAAASERQAMRASVSRKQDRMFVDGGANFTMVKQDDGAGAYYLAAPGEVRCNPVSTEADQSKKGTVLQSDRRTEEGSERAVGSGADAWSPQRQSQASTPSPQMPVESSGSAAAASASGPGSPTRGRAFSRTLRRQRQSTATNNGSGGTHIRPSRSRSKAGNVRVTVEVRTPQGSPEKGSRKRQSLGRAGEEGNEYEDTGGRGNGSGNDMGERVVIVTTDVQEEVDE